MKVVNIAQRTPEWLKWRSTRIAASDAPAVMGDSPWDTPTTLWELKLGKRPPKPVNPAMLKGIKLEDMVRALYTEITGHLVTPMCAEHDFFDFMAASFDGVSLFQDRLAEIKVSAKTFREVKATGTVPKHYWAQVQHQLAVCSSAKYNDFVAYNPDVPKNAPIDDRIVILPVARDEAYISQLIEREREFVECIRTGKQPASDAFLDAAKMFVRLDEEIKSLQVDYENAKKILIESVPDGNDRYSGGGVLVTKSKKKGSIDYEKILADKGITLTEDELNAYRGKESKSVRVTVQGA